VSGIRTNPNLGGVKMGLIVPSVNTTIEPELYGLGLPGVSFHTARVMLAETTPAGIAAMNLEVEGAARLLATVDPHVLVYACTSGTFLEGWEGLQRQLARLGALVACPVVATSAAMVAALTHLGVRRLALATPYLDSVNALERDFLRGRGFDVVTCRGLGLSGRAIRAVEPAAVVDLVLAADHPAAEAVFVSCTDLRALETVDHLEARLAKPVLTSNQVTLWAALRALRFAGKVEGYGSLLAAGAA
jgi:maleate cis-trans isomerase